MSIVSDAVWAPSPSTSRGQPTKLSADPKGERIAYVNSKSIFLRNIDNPAISRQYTGHVAQTSVAKFSPSGFYVASGDVSGMVRVWDCVGEGSTKGEFHIISGRINDIAWDGDSQRIIAVGDGKQSMGRCITYDSGNSVGEIAGHSAQINAVAIRQQRPLRAATVSNDMNMVFYHGAPFKFNTSLKGKHINAIYGVEFSPDGTSLVSVGSDKRIWLYDGKTGEAKGQIGQNEHKGSIFGVSWASDSNKVVTASADQTVKIWDIEVGKALQSWRFGDEGVVNIQHHQVGVVWPRGRFDGLLISLNLLGDLNYLVEGEEAPVRVVEGNQGNITSITVTENTSEKFETLWTGSYDGRICAWDIASGVVERVDGPSHTNQITGLASITHGHGGRVYSVAWDDTLRMIDSSTRSFIGTAAKLDGQPKDITSITTRELLTVVATHKGLDVFSPTNEKLSELPTKYQPTCISAACVGDEANVAVGGDDNVVYIYALDDSKLTPKTTLAPKLSPITCVAYSPSSPSAAHLAVGTSQGPINVHLTSDYKKIATTGWSAHTGRVMSISWRPDGKYAASGGLDTHVFVWSLENPTIRIRAANAHKEGVNGVCWVEDGKKVVSVGWDAAVKLWNVTGLK